MLTNENNHLMLSEKTYAIAKRLVQVILPAFGALYFGLGQIWGFPAIENVVGSITIITTFLGVVLGISTSNYYKSGAAYDGDMVITESVDGPKTFSLQLDGDPEDLAGMSSIRFRVCNDPSHQQSDI